ncbi:MAG TPA: DNA translocase FtsK 4TM domain-containing protein [Gemmatimonadaceae bacterium]|nr:DNA translocase FtsK 4TM domain-containing protein [Gemmatimonadaceae bacterium]
MGSTGLKRELIGIALLLFSVFLAGALIALAASTLRGGVDVRHSVGFVGYYLAYPVVSFFGWPGAALVPAVPAVHALRLFGRLESETDRSWMIFLAGVAVLLPVAVGISVTDPRADSVSNLAGIWGGFVGYYWRAWFGGFGAWVVLLLAASVLTAVTLRWNPVRMIVGRRAAVPVAADSLPSEEPYAPPKRRKKKDANLALALEPPPEEFEALDALAALQASSSAAADAKEDAAIEEVEKRRGKKKKGDEPSPPPGRDERIHAAIDATERPAANTDELPPTDLLNYAPARNLELGKRELDMMGAKLMEALRTFKVDGNLVNRTTGPTVTQYEIEPASGVKVRQFANLSNDLALAMRAASIRIVAPIPGRGAVGVEVPNPTPEMVGFRELVEHNDFKGARAGLPIVLGKDLEGKPVIADLAKMPHLLIAGATGSGKSVCVNTIITSLVYRHTPKTLRFLMVDPKMVELSVYNTLPHLRHKVITDNRDAAAVLKWAVMEMQERYELLAANGCRNLQDFNRRVQDASPLKKPRNKDVAFEDDVYKNGILPYIVVVIDEMADLMMTVQGEVETPIAMLAQKARAIGIHLILATQRPSVNVITGLIKANFPSRIAFRVASQIDSRTIIDGGGAESLLGNGDMLFIPPGKSEPSRLQGAYLSSEETEKLMKWYEAQRDRRRAELSAAGLVMEAEMNPDEPDILETVRTREAEARAALDGGGDEGGPSEGTRDPLFREAAELCIQNQSGSTSLLQRRLGIGYGRAARVIDQLADAGVLDAKSGPKGREVRVGLEDLDRICGVRDQ